MERTLGLLFILMVIVGVAALFYVLGRATIIDWAHAEGDVDYIPTPKEVIVFIILYVTAYEALIAQLKNKK